MKHKTIQEALQFVADHPRPSVEAPVEAPIWELIARELFAVANSPDPRVRGSLARATKAQKIILDRLVGRRRPGTHPAQVQSDEIDFVDLTSTILLPPSEPDTEESDDE